MNAIPKPEVPLAENLGNWVRLRPVRYESASGKLRVGYWVVEFENAVGGQISYRFKTRNEALYFRSKIYLLKPQIRAS